MNSAGARRAYLARTLSVNHMARSISSYHSACCNLAADRTDVRRGRPRTKGEHGGKYTSGCNLFCKDFGNSRNSTSLEITSGAHGRSLSEAWAALPQQNKNDYNLTAAGIRESAKQTELIERAAKASEEDAGEQQQESYWGLGDKYSPFSSQHMFAKNVTSPSGPHEAPRPQRPRDPELPKPHTAQAEEWAERIHKPIMHVEGTIQDIEHEKTCSDFGICRKEYRDVWQIIMVLVQNMHAAAKVVDNAIVDECRCLWLVHGRRAAHDDCAVLVLIALRQKAPYRLVFQHLRSVDANCLLHEWA
eukprot:7906835-Pyramimonas_sp.AAC.1